MAATTEQWTDQQVIAEVRRRLEDRIRVASDHNDQVMVDALVEFLEEGLEDVAYSAEEGDWFPGDIEIFAVLIGHPRLDLVASTSSQEGSQNGR